MAEMLVLLRNIPCVKGGDSQSWDIKYTAKCNSQFCGDGGHFMFGLTAIERKMIDMCLAYKETIVYATASHSY